jgi:hypothetical protein
MLTNYFQYIFDNNIDLVYLNKNLYNIQYVHLNVLNYYLLNYLLQINLIHVQYEKNFEHKINHMHNEDDHHDVNVVPII